MNPYGVSDEVLSAMMQYVSEVGFTEDIVVGQGSRPPVLGCQKRDFIL